MNKINIAKFQEALDKKYKELNDYAMAQVANIPIQLPPSTAIQQAAHPIYQAPRTILITGMATLVVGLLGNSTFLSIAGVCVTAYGGYLSTKKGEKTSTVPDINIRSLARNISKQLEPIISHITTDWDNFLGVQKDTLKNEVQMMKAEAEKKNALMDIAVKRSIISFSILNIKSTLNNVAKDGDINALKACIKTFVKELLTAIELAYKEQSRYYADMNSFLTTQNEK